jgi:hypothetical protein
MSLILKTRIMKKITILLFAIAALGAGCKKFTDINNNPNQPLTVTPNVLLSAALTGSGNGLGADFLNTPRWMGYWARSGNFITTPPVEDYQEDVSFADNDWQDYYSTLNRYNNIEIAGKQSPTTLSFYIGVAKTMKALHFSTLVDAFGDVPYSQAFNLNKFPNPKYDDAATIYADLVNQLDSAVTYFDAAKAYYALGAASSSAVKTDDQYDIMFGRGAGVDPNVRVDNWVKLANTIKLRLLLTEENASSVGASVVSAELAKTTANGRGYLMAGTSASVNPGYSNSSATRLNPLYNVFYQVSGSTSNGYAFNRANQYAVNMYNLTGDIRISGVYTPVGGKILGNYDGDPNAGTNAVTAGVSGTNAISSASQSQMIFSDFESLFWQAEAAQRGFNVGGSTATALATQGIEQSFIYLGNAQADADAYIAANTGSVLVDPATGLQAIMTQKWISLNTVNWQEAYTDYRRTGFPAPDPVNNTFGFTKAPAPTLHNGKLTIPFRFLYPQSEISTNGKNIPAGKTQFTPVFWDTREQ